MVNKDGVLGHSYEPPVRYIGDERSWYYAHEDTVAPEYRGHPPQSYLECAERDNPDGGLVERKGMYPSGQ